MECRSTTEFRIKMIEYWVLYQDGSVVKRRTGKTKAAEPVKPGPNGSRKNFANSTSDNYLISFYSSDFRWDESASMIPLPSLAAYNPSHDDAFRDPTYDPAIDEGNYSVKVTLGPKPQTTDHGPDHCSDNRPQTLSYVKQAPPWILTVTPLYTLFNASLFSSLRLTSI